MKTQLKKFIERTPYPVGRLFARIPFSYRLGKHYRAFGDLINKPNDDKNYILNHFSAIFEHAKENLPFYQAFYKEAGVEGLKIRTLDDIKKVPILSKARLRDQLHLFQGAIRLNTGGTSGSPMPFYVDKHAHAREWAYMHNIWSLRGYHYRDTKLTLRGKNLGNKGIQYNPVHNEFIVNTYLPPTEYLERLLEVVSKHNIRYLHGYPSAIYNFLKGISHIANEDEISTLKMHFSSCLLGSEFPMPYMSKYIKEKWNLDYISWYGHSEMCILAYDEYCKNQYTPFHSYGYVEVEHQKLIGTSYHNFDMPLIRYDSGDLVAPRYQENGILESFSIQQGREGDFVEDKQGLLIPITGLLFGRHHKAFDVLDCIQVKQVAKGKITFLVTTTKNIPEKKLYDLFDMSHAAIDHDIKVIDSPILTKAGKQLLLVR